MNNLLKSYFLGDKHNKSDGVVEYMLLKEGLITSYNIDTLKRKIKQLFQDRIEFGKFKTRPVFDYDSYSFYIHVKNYDKNDDVKLNKLLDLFGYYIVKGNNNEDVYIYNKYKIHTITIEPKYPIVINDVLRYHAKFLYHITPLSNLSKIKKYGLAPRGSETTFYHPNDRIYLIYSPVLSYISQFKQLLADDKINKFKMQDVQMAVLRTPFNDKYTYYLDDSVITHIKNAYGCFVLKNIPPEELELTNL